MMSPIARGLAASCLFSVSATLAQADLAAQDVWADWRAYLSSSGYEVSGTEAMSGDVLTITGMTMTMDMPESSGSLVVGIDSLTFTENGDGTVSVGFPASMPIRITGVNEKDEPFDMTLDYSQTGLSMVVSGSPEDMTYNYTAASMGLAMSSFLVNGAAVPADTARGSASLGNVTGTTRMMAGAVRNYAQSFQSTGLSYDVFFRDPEGQGQVTIAGQSQSLNLEGVSNLPEEMNTENLSAMIKAGFAGSGSITFGPGATKMTFQEEGESFDYDSTSQGGVLKVGLGPSGLEYDLSQSMVTVNVMGSEIPLPVSLSMAEMGLRLAFPTVASDADQDFALALNLSDFSMSDLLWSLFDPAQQLPRDPATLRIVTSGKAKLTADVFDPEVAASLEASGAAPGELSALTISDLTLRAAGAELTGSGDFTFDNTDKVTFDGMPKPTGALNLKLVGGNGLLDKLVAMGLLPEDQAMGARMMMGLFAVPGTEPDTLNSKIEINDQGHVLANGQRIQ
ncbi:MAG: DUF2125 domain-containing protein [Rhodobacteraceae bacterium]|nr:MAG: DUF2125 domain-containing protein [Paracoccaceae bacterium]